MLFPDFKKDEKVECTLPKIIEKCKHFSDQVVYERPILNAVTHC